MSRIGKKPIAIPANVKVEAGDNRIHIEGPKGKLQLIISGRIGIEIKDNKITLSRATDIKTDKSLHGLYRALIVNMIKGVTDGYEKQLEIIGVGYKAQIQGKVLNMQLGYSHPVNIPIPEGLTIETPKPTVITIKGINKELVGKTASEIRMVCPPEPYKGKGIRYLGEYIKKKVGKAQATGGAK